MPTLFNAKKVAFLSFYFVIFMTIIFLLSHQLSGHNYPSDTIAHLGFSKQFFDGTRVIAHPLWHICVHYMTYITLDEKFSAAMVTAIFVTMWIYIVQALYLFFMDKTRHWLFTYVFLLIIFLIGPAYIKSFTKHIYLGTGSPNVWHNVTLLTVKPFALLAVFFTIRGLEKKHILYYVIGAMSLVFSIFAKPSFVMAFLPAIVILFILRKYYSKENIIYMLLLITISAGLSGWQFLHVFGEDKTKIVIDFLGVWSHYTPNVFVSILLALCFPLMYLVFNFKLILNNDYLIVSWIMILFSILYAAFLAEKGPRFYHFNFSWSYMISLSLLYVFTFVDYLKNIVQIKTRIKFLLNIIVVWQLIVGTYYFYTILLGKTYV